MFQYFIFAYGPLKHLAVHATQHIPFEAMSPEFKQKREQ